MVDSAKPLVLPHSFGRYVLRRLVGSGGMAKVYLAEDRALQRSVALKIPHSRFEASQVEFLREARAAAKIQHPNICTVFDVGIFDQKPYLTMEFIEGNSLDKMIATAETMSVETAIVLFEQIASAVGQAHRRGVIHRDLKPANILMRDGKIPLVTDFGLALEPTREPPSQKKLIGSPSYMSPEQVRSATDISSLTDIYGLGTILYEMLTSRRPFVGDIDSVYAQVLTQPATPPSQVRPELDPRFDAILAIAMSKQPDDRYPDTETFVDDVQEVRDKPRRRIKLNKNNSGPVRIAPSSAQSVGQSAYANQAAAMNEIARQKAWRKRSRGRAAAHKLKWTIGKQRTGIYLGLTIAILVTLVVSIGLWWFA